jgi:hypothetical protein
VMTLERARRGEGHGDDAHGVCGGREGGRDPARRDETATNATSSTTRCGRCDAQGGPRRLLLSRLGGAVRASASHVGGAGGLSCSCSCSDPLTLLSLCCARAPTAPPSSLHLLVTPLLDAWKSQDVGLAAQCNASRVGWPRTPPCSSPSPSTSTPP